jgi:hypothetical protein
MRWRAEAGVMSDATVLAGDQFEGLAVIELLLGNGTVSIYNRAGHLYLELHTREMTGGAYVNVSIDLGLESDFFVGRGDDAFGEMIIHFVGDPAGNQITVDVWVGDACSLVGAAATASVTKPAFKFSAGTVAVGVQTVEHFNWIFTPTGANKALWWADWEMEPESASSNPFDVIP